MFERSLVDDYERMSGNWTGRRLLFISSTSVYAQTTGEWVTEASEVEPTHESGKILRKTEDLVLSKRGTVARLAGIYGPGRSALLRRLLNGEATIDPESDRFVNQIHRDDAASAIRLLIGKSESAAQVYNVVDNEPIQLSECYRWLATKLNRPIPPTA